MPITTNPNRKTMYMTMFEMIQEFNRRMSVPQTARTDEARLELATSLIEEEWGELMDELYPVSGKIDYSKVGKELADLLYVCFSLADVLQLPIEEIYRRVHESNMSKLGDDGKPVRNEFGKVIKGPNYKKPDLSFVK